MLMNKSTEREPKLVREVMESQEGIEFWLTGSWYFGTAGEESDFDYFCLNSQENKNWLHEMGFVYVGAEYRDSLTENVMRRVDTDGKQIDVQLVKDVAVKEQAQILIAQSELLLTKAFRGLDRAGSKFHKHYHRALWDMVITALTNGRFKH